MFGDVVLGIDHDDFEHELSAIKKSAGAKFDIELTAAHLKDLVSKYKVGAGAGSSLVLVQNVDGLVWQSWKSRMVMPHVWVAWRSPTKAVGPMICQEGLQCNHC